MRGELLLSIFPIFPHIATLFSDDSSACCNLDVVWMCLRGINIYQYCHTCRLFDRLASWSRGSVQVAMNGLEYMLTVIITV